MDGKIFNIPFRTRSRRSDFSCKDGEIDSVSGLLSADGTPVESSDNMISRDSSVVPAPEISFALVRDCLKGWHIHPDMYPSKTIVASDPTMDYWTRMAAQLLSQFKSDAAYQDLLVSPCYVMAAWKTADTYLSPSLPEILIPNSLVPLVGTDGDIGSTELEFKLAAAVCKLYFRIKVSEALRDHTESIESLEILVSEPLQKYDTFQAFLPSRRVTTDSTCTSLDLSTGEIAERRICTDTLSLAWRANMKGNPGNQNSYSDIKFFPFASVALEELHKFSDWTDTITASGIRVSNNSSGKGIKFSALGEMQAGNKSSEEVILTGSGEDFRVMTRPIKLGDAGRFKRALSLALRGKFDSSSLTVTLQGSRDMRHWFTLGSRKRGATLVFRGPLCRFFRVEVRGRLEAGETLEGMVWHSGD